MAKGIRKPGEFCWINMLTPQPAEARAFFSKLLGWTYVEMTGVTGHLVQVGGHGIGAIFDLAAPNTPPGTPPLIGVMVKVESADATVDKAIALGGSARPAFDIMDAGRMSVVHDPNGAQLDVWEPKKMLGTDADTSEHGAPSWFDTMTTDVDRAASFYAGLFGWKPEVQRRWTEPTPGYYVAFKHGGNDAAGMMQITPEMGKTSPHWSTYFTVKDVDKTVREATALGGQLCMPVQDVAGVGRFSILTSPQGVTFNVIQYPR
jgi:predicted enzyme related to lactoylglutathione lyase